RRLDAGRRVSAEATRADGWRDPATVTEAEAPAALTVTLRAIRKFPPREPCSGFGSGLLGTRQIVGLLAIFLRSQLIHQTYTRVSSRPADRNICEYPRGEHVPAPPETALPCRPRRQPPAAEGTVRCTSGLACREAALHGAPAHRRRLRR